VAAEKERRCEMRDGRNIRDFVTDGFTLESQHPAKLSIMIDPNANNEVRIWLTDEEGVGEALSDSILPMFVKAVVLSRSVAERIGGFPFSEEPLFGEPWVWRWYPEMTVEQIVAFLEEKLSCKLIPH
jgi:hypothetical protein